MTDDFFNVKIKKNKKIQHSHNSSKINGKIIERVKIDTPNTHIHHFSFSWLVTSTSVKTNGGVKPVVSEIMWNDASYDNQEHESLQF